MLAQRDICQRHATGPGIREVGTWPQAPTFRNPKMSALTRKCRHVVRAMSRARPETPCPHSGRIQQLRVEVLELPVPQLGLLRQDQVLGIAQHTVETTQDGERQDDILIPAPLEDIAYEVATPQRKLTISL